MHVANRIISSQNQDVKHVVRLRQKRYRDRHRQLLIEGVRELELAAVARIPIHTLFIQDEILNIDDYAPLLTKLQYDCGASITSITKSIYEKIAYRENTEGLIAVAAQWDCQLAQLRVPESELFIVASSIEKPGNLGAIFRCADAVGADGVVICDPRTDVFNPNVIRTSLGTLFSVPFATAALSETNEWLFHNKLRTIITSPVAETSYWTIDLTGPIAIVVGNEQFGLSNEWFQHGFESVCLPKQGKANSLNVAMTAAVMLFESRRQRDVLSRNNDS